MHQIAAPHLLDTVFWTDVHLECFNLFGCSSASEVHYAAFACRSQTRYRVHPAIRAARSMLVGSLYTTESLPIVGKYVASLLCATYAVLWQQWGRAVCQRQEMTALCIVGLSLDGHWQAHGKMKGFRLSANGAVWVAIG